MRYQLPAVATSTVPATLPSLFGLDDTTGNASEWKSDWMGVYAADAITNPTGAGTGDKRVIRGGSWSNTGDGGRLSVRYSARPEYAVGTVGFRCVMDQPLVTP